MVEIKVSKNRNQPNSSTFRSNKPARLSTPSLPKRLTPLRNETDEKTGKKEREKRKERKGKKET